MNDDALDRGREMFRDMARRHHDATRDLASQRKTLHELALAAVEAHELLGDAVSQYGADLPEDARQALDLVRQAARERLERAGLRLDGAVGETLDLSRHRVLKTRRRAGLDWPRVTTVVRSGVLLGETRLRVAEVVIDEPEAR